MKGDFDRETFDPRKHYAGVLGQQGRVATAADWNEQGEIVRRRIRIEARDVIGPCGGPEDDCGFAITLSGGTLGIGAGRYYVDGILCENEQDGVPYGQQPDYPGAPDWTTDLGTAQYALAYLDVWGRHVTALDDPRLREVALGGPDSDTRLKRVWQVKILPLAITGSADELAALQKKRASIVQKRAAAAAAGDTPTVQKADAEIAKIDALIATLSAGPTCDSPYDEWDALVADPDRRLNARTTAPPPDQGPCIVPPAAGYRRLENQLYRVEVHRGSDAGTPTFKWSRDNGTVVTTIRKISGKEIDVDDLGPDDVLGFASGQWVELSDDALELAGKPGELAQIDSIDLGLRRITLLTAPATLAANADGVDPARHPKLRRWDQTDGATADGVAIGAGWVALEDGIEVQFSGAGFKTGDYWTIPARTATGEIEWPPFAIPNQSPEAQPPRGIRHHYCRLALLALDAASGAWSVVEDCRRPFPPLTDPTCCSATSLHVAGINWENDGSYLGSGLTTDGLRITLDGPPDPACLSNDTVQVAVELPYPPGDTPSPIQRVRIHLLGTVGPDSADPNVIVWRLALDTPQMVGDVSAALREITAAATVAATPAARTRRAAAATAAAVAPRAAAPSAQVYVTVKGHCVWRRSAVPRPGERSDGSARQAAGSALVYLDGQAFARPGVQADGTTPRIDLVFPTGQSAKASDFESWFGFGRPKPPPTPLQVTTVRFLNPNGATSSAGDVTVPRTPSDPQVGFKAGEQIIAVQVVFNRAFVPDSLGTAAAPSVFITPLATAGPPVRLSAAISAESATVARLVLREPSFIPKGPFRLTCLGTSPAGTTGLGVKAADDQSFLDGDYDNQSGGDFTLDFTAL